MEWLRHLGRCLLLLATFPLALAQTSPAPGAPVTPPAAQSAPTAKSPAAPPLPAAAPVAQTIPATPPNQAGTIVLAEGEAKIIKQGAAPRPAKAGDVVSEGDVLVTGQGGQLHMTMQDTGFIALRPNTRFRVVSYKADGGSDDNGIFRLVAGGFRSVTGWIGKFNRNGYRVNTPSATIGIRGTDHEPRYIPEGSSEGEPGTYDRVYAGESYIETPAGTAAVAPKQAGFVSIRQRDRPRLLAAIPVFFRPGPHEAEIDKKHEEIQKMIDQRREERRKVIAAKRAELGVAREQTKAQLQQNKAAVEQGKAAAQAHMQEAKEKREALQSEMKGAQEIRKDTVEKRKALQEDFKSGALSPQELRERRKAIREQGKTAQDALKDVEEQRKALKESNEAQTDARIKAAEDRLKALKEQVQDVKEKRKALDDERESAKKEIQGLQQEEGKRYREELKADKKAAPKPSRTDGEDKQP